MTLVLYKRAAPSDRLRLWLGALDRPGSDLEWTLDGQTVAAEVVRAMAPAHSGAASTYTGVYDIVGSLAAPVVADRAYTVAVREKGARGRRAEISTWTLPTEVPWDIGSSFRVLLASCFYREQDKQGRASSVAARLPQPHRPHLSLLMGDQVYLDLPTLTNFRDKTSWLASKFELDYRRNWADADGRGYNGVLSSAPSICTADDHEYWNNYPHSSPFIQNTWTEGGRARWRSVSDELLAAYQQPDPVAMGDPCVLNVEPLSFLALDTRTRRQEDCSRSMSEHALASVKEWVTETIESQRFGVVITGQSLLDEPVGRLKGKVADRMLANYGDYPELVSELARLAEVGRPVVLLTGDVHWGRVTRIHAGGKLRFIEIICSPTSLVSTVGSDQLKSIGSALRGIFGRRDRWPRHAQPEPPPDYFARHVFGNRYSTERSSGHWGQRGDQLATLAFRQHGSGLQMTVTYWPVGGDAAAPADAGTFTLNKQD